MKKLILILSFLTLNLTFSQSTTKLSVIESAEYKDKVKSTDILAIHTSNEGLTGIVRSSKKHILFDVFNTSLEKVFSHVVDSHKKERYVGDLFYGDEIKFFTVYTPKHNIREVNCHVFNLKTKSYKKVKVFEVTVAKSKFLFPSKDNRQTSFAISPDGNYIAISTDNIKKNINSYTIRLLKASNLEIVFQKSYQEHKERFLEPNDLSVDDNGTVFALGKLFIKGKKQKKKGDANYEFVLNKVTKDSNDELKVSLDEEHIKSLTISNVDNKLHLLGFYSEKNVSRIKGGCNFIIDKENFAVSSKRTYKLPTEVYEDLYGYRKANKKKKKNYLAFI